MKEKKQRGGGEEWVDVMPLAELSDICTGWSHAQWPYNWSTSTNGLRQTLSWLPRYREDQVLCPTAVVIWIILGKRVVAMAQGPGSSTQLSYVGHTDQSDCTTAVVEFHFDHIRSK